MDERRSGGDRRRKPTQAFSFYTLVGRRASSGRRDGDRPGYVDLYSPLLFMVLLAIVGLSVADAYLTLDALAGGCREVNPLMDAALGLGPRAFVAIKLVVTGLGVVLLCLHKNFPRVRWIILTVLVGYVLLIGWHVHLLQFRIG